MTEPDEDQQPEDEEGVRLTLFVHPEVLDELILGAAELDESPTDAINRAMKFYVECMRAEVGREVVWTFADGSQGRVMRTR